MMKFSNWVCPTCQGSGGLDDEAMARYEKTGADELSVLQSESAALKAKVETAEEIVSLARRYKDARRRLAEFSAQAVVRPRRDTEGINLAADVDEALEAIDRALGRKPGVGVESEER